MATTPRGGHESPVAQTRRMSLREWYESPNSQAMADEDVISTYGPLTPVRRKKRTSLGGWWMDDAGLPDGRTPETKEFFLDDEDAAQVQGQLHHDMVATPCSARRGGGFSPCFSNSSSPSKIRSRLPSAITSPQCVGVSAVQAELPVAHAYSFAEYYAAHCRSLPVEALDGLYREFPQRRAETSAKLPAEPEEVEVLAEQSMSAVEQVLPQATSSQAFVGPYFDAWRRQVMMPAWLLAEIESTAEQTERVAEPSNLQSVEVPQQRRVDPMLDGRVVSWNEYVRAHSIDELTPNQLLEHWLNLHLAQDPAAADAAEEARAWGAGSREPSRSEQSEASGRFVDLMAAMARETTANVLERMALLAAEASSLVTGEDDEAEGVMQAEVSQQRDRMPTALQAAEDERGWVYGPSLSGTWEALCELFEDTRDTVIETSRFVMSAREQYHQRHNVINNNPSSGHSSSSTETPMATVSAAPASHQ